MYKIPLNIIVILTRILGVRYQLGQIVDSFQFGLLKQDDLPGLPGHQEMFVREPGVSQAGQAVSLHEAKWFEISLD